MSELVVLGPTGNVGSALLRLLLSQDVGVRTGNRQDFDYFQPKTYAPLFRGATHLFLLTPITEQMVELTEALLMAAQKAGIRRIVKLSALGAHQKSPVRLLRWHGEAERLMEKTGLPCVSLRPNAFMQNFSQFQGRAIRATGKIAAPAGDSRVSFIDANDVAKAAARVLLDDTKYGAFELTGPESLSYAEVARRLSTATGKRIAYENVTEERARADMERGKVPPWKAEALLELYQSYKRGEGETLTSDLAELTQTTGRRLDSFFIQHREDFL